MVQRQNPFNAHKKEMLDAVDAVETSRKPSTAVKRQDSKAETLVPKVETLVPKVETIVANTAVDGEVSSKDDVPSVQLDAKNPLKKVYPEEEILPILDSLLHNGYAIDKFTIRGIDVILRTRFTWEEQYVYKHLEYSEVNTALAYQREYTFITLAASLVQYGTYMFEPINKGDEEVLDKSMSERYDFIRSLNSVVTDMLQVRLGQFDDKQRYIISNFDELLKSF